MARSSTERPVADRPRVIRERRARVELNGLEEREEGQCLKKVDTKLVVAFDRLVLDRDLIRAALRIKFDAAPKYMIRALNPQITGENEFSVVPELFVHGVNLSVVPDIATVTEVRGAGNGSPAEA